MRICLFSDVHCDVNSSIIRSRGERFSIRLEHLIDSLNFVNQVALKNNCEMLMCGGDFFNKSRATDEELTALREVNWTNLPCYFVCGNHESSVNDLRYNALKALESDNHIIISQPQSIKISNCNFLFLPYVVESNRKPITEYFTTQPDIIISHNDISGMNYGGFVSNVGFSIEEIEANCKLFLNGHLHNSEWVTKKILNLGSLSAHNFTNDSFKYKYGVWILDTDDLSVKFIENPHGFRFYKFSVENEEDLSIIDYLDVNSIVSVNCVDELYAECVSKIESKENIIENRVVAVRGTCASSAEVSEKDLRDEDYLQKLVTFCKANIEQSDVLTAELTQIIK